MQKGKKLEKEVKEYLKKEGVFHHQFTDSYMSGRVGQPVPSDFLIIPKISQVILLECKEHEGYRLPISCFTPSQLKTMEETIGTLCGYYIVVNMENRYYLVYSEYVLDCIKDNIKSITFDNFVEFPNVKEVMDFLLKVESL